jgi:hypothetical protein
MKKFLRISLVILLLLAGTALLLWYFFMRREIPKHARCIPKDAVAVLTLNLRELALDQSAGGHLFPEMAGKKIFSKELESFSKAVEANGGTGLSETADVLGFLFRDGEEAYWGVCAGVKDSAKFGKLLREQLTKDFPIHPVSQNGFSLVRFDTSSIILGWNKDAAVLLYPFGNSDASQTALHCVKLLSQKEEQSVLADENFREHELSSFDAGLWMQPAELLKLTQGGKLMKTYFAGEKYISLFIDFTNGEIITRKIVTMNNAITKKNLPVLLNCDPAQVKGFYHAVFDMNNDSLVKLYPDIPPFNSIPFNDERTEQLDKTLDGNFTMLLHDTFSYQADYITYDYDENFERIEKHEKKRETMRAFSSSFGLKDPAAAQKLLNTWAAEDSLRKEGNAWIVEHGNKPVRIILSGNVLTISNWEKTDGQSRSLPEAWEGLDAAIPVGKILVKDYEGIFSFFLPKMENGAGLLSDNIGDLLVSVPTIKGNENSCQVRLTMENKKVNALVQLEELFRKAAEN